MTFPLVDEAIYMESCSVCGVQYGLTGRFMGERRKDHKDFYCPNGHNQYYSGESEAEKYKRLLERQIADTERQTRYAEMWKRSRSAARGALTKIKKRIAAGVCPGCNRTFQDLARHMKSKHPKYVEESA